MVWILAASGWAATEESGPSPGEIEAVSPRCATLLETGLWYPPTLPAGSPRISDWPGDLRRLCSADRASEEQRLRAVYGVGDYAGHLFESIRRAAAVVPRFADLVYEPSGRYMPQMGLLLVDYVELPTRSAFEEQRWSPASTTTSPATQTAPAEIPQGPRTRVVGIRDYVHGRPAPGATTPEIIAAELRQHADACRSRLPALRHLNPTDPVQSQQLSALLDRIELAANLAEHMLHKIQAAVAWERFRKGEGNEVECTRRLQQSLEDWARLVTVANHVFPEPLPWWQAQMISGPPWSIRQYQASYVPVRAHWSQQKWRFEHELRLLSEAIRVRKGSATLPLWDRVDAVPAQRLDLVLAFGFNLNPDRRYALKDGATPTQDLRLALTGGRSVLIDTRTLGPGEHVTFVTDPAHATMLAYRAYQISVLYRVVDRGGQDNDPFEIGMLSPEGQSILGERRRWGAPENTIDTRVIKTPRLDRDNYSFFVKVHGPAAMVIDDLRISALRDD